LAAARVMSKGRTWSVYQGRATSLKLCTSERGMFERSSTVALMGTALAGAAGYDIYVYIN
jgi:hypothetical protein